MSAPPPPAFPRYESAEQLVAACDESLAAARARVAALESMPPGVAWLAAYDDITAFVEDASGPVYLLQNVHPERAIRDAAQACTLRWGDFESTLGQNATLFASLQRMQGGDAIDRGFAAYCAADFEDSGVGLPPAQRVRAKQISDRITEAGQAFSARVRDTRVELPFHADELRGVPDAVWKDKPRDDAGRYLLGIDAPTVLPVLERAEASATRERMWRAKQNEGGADNLVLLAELAALRREYAQLFGVRTFAEFQLRRRMAETPARATRFLDGVKAAVAARELRDLDELRQAKASHLGTPPESTRLERWDTAYYAERLRNERYAVDQEAFRRHFPSEHSLRFVMRVAETIFGVRYAELPMALWHAEAKAFAVADAASGDRIATLFVDAYPRDGKYGHAAVFSFRNGATRVGRLPQAALVVNFNREGLTLQELETLLHEFGHALHNNLSQTRYVGQAGTRVQRDFVEAPSQMLEDWVYDKGVLELFADVCPSCLPVPDAMIEQARAARDQGKGMRVARQHLYAAYDLALYGEDEREPLELWSAMEAATPLGHVAGTVFPAAFGHIAGGYAAGYYGYLWAYVVALDLRSAFAGGRLDASIGARYRQAVLSQGRQRPPDDLVRDFLGRDTDSTAFFADLAQ